MRLVADPELKARCSPVPYFLLWILPRQGKSPISGGYQVGGRSPCLWPGVDTITARGAAGGHEWTELWLLARALWWVLPPPHLRPFSSSQQALSTHFCFFDHPLLQPRFISEHIFLLTGPAVLAKPPLAQRGAVPRSSPWGF